MDCSLCPRRARRLSLVGMPENSESSASALFDATRPAAGLCPDGMPLMAKAR